MNEKEIQNFYETIEYEIHKISSNEAYINNSRYFGLSKELLSYIRKLENVLDEIKKYINETLDLKEEYQEEVECVVNDISEIIKKAKGE